MPWSQVRPSHCERGPKAPHKLDLFRGQGRGWGPFFCCTANFFNLQYFILHGLQIHILWSTVPIIIRVQSFALYQVRVAPHREERCRTQRPPRPLVSPPLPAPRGGSCSRRLLGSCSRRRFPAGAPATPPSRSGSLACRARRWERGRPPRRILRGSRVGLEPVVGRPLEQNGVLPWQLVARVEVFVVHLKYLLLAPHESSYARRVELVQVLIRAIILVEKYGSCSVGIQALLPLLKYSMRTFTYVWEHAAILHVKYAGVAK